MDYALWDLWGEAREVMWWACAQQLKLCLSLPRHKVPSLQQIGSYKIGIPFLFYFIFKTLFRHTCYYNTYLSISQTGQRPPPMLFSICLSTFCVVCPDFLIYNFDTSRYMIDLLHFTLPLRIWLHSLFNLYCDNYFITSNNTGHYFVLFTPYVCM